MSNGAPCPVRVPVGFAQPEWIADIARIVLHNNERTHRKRARKQHSVPVPDTCRTAAVQGSTVSCCNDIQASAHRQCTVVQPDQQRLVVPASPRQLVKHDSLLHRKGLPDQTCDHGDTDNFQDGVFAQPGELAQATNEEVAPVTAGVSRCCNSGSVCFLTE